MAGKFFPTGTHSVPEQILNRIDWHIIRRLDGMLQGDYRTLFYGSGLDFSDLREYQPRDDIRHIAWNVTARMNAPYVRQYVEDREVTAWFLIDLTGSMTFGPQDNPKKRQMVDFIGTLAQLLAGGGNRVGALIFRGDKMKMVHLPPRGGRKQILILIKELIKEHVPGSSFAPTNLNHLFDRAVATLKRRSLVIAVSDFISEPGWVRPFGHLTRRHECLAVRFWDPLEYELPAVGLIPVEDIETGEQLWVNTSDPAFQRRFAAAAARRLQALEEAFQSAGVDPFAVSTADEVVDALFRLAQQRRQKRRAVR